MLLRVFGLTQPAGYRCSLKELHTSQKESLRQSNEGISFWDIQTAGECLGGWAISGQGLVICVLGWTARAAKYYVEGVWFHMSHRSKGSAESE